ncbi:hydroxymethylbilane synthase [Anaplasmataceae bacterium AB001_6]|nr:hydroxymethylbilane synthase [Anaplasmataceae bacterium AB001_6]
MECIKIGSRSSTLAIKQAEIAKNMLESLGHKCDIIGIKTSGDRIRSKISEYGGKALFVKKIEEKLLNKTIHLAVHSLKDIPAFIDDRLSIPCTLKRNFPNDVLISKKFSSINELKHNAIIGTSSYRRQTFLEDKCKFINIRGNIDSRIEKTLLLDGIILAQAGIERINIKNHIRDNLKMKMSQINTAQFIPSPGQGTIALQCRKDDDYIMNIISQISDKETMLCSIAERAFMKYLNADCTVPMAAYAFIESDKIVFNSMLRTKKGIFYNKTTDKIERAKEIGTENAKKLCLNSDYK